METATAFAGLWLASAGNGPGCACDVGGASGCASGCAIGCAFVCWFVCSCSCSCCGCGGPCAHPWVGPCHDPHDVCPCLDGDGLRFCSCGGGHGHDHGFCSATYAMSSLHRLVCSSWHLCQHRLLSLVLMLTLMPTTTKKKTRKRDFESFHCSPCAQPGLLARHSV